MTTEHPANTVTLEIPPNRIDPLTGMYLLTPGEVDALIDAGARAAIATIAPSLVKRDKAYAQAGADAIVTHLLSTKKLRPVVRHQTYRRDTPDGPPIITSITDVVEEVTFEVSE